ncbi:MAG TPA: radical SAM protein [Candidatus Omnitrophota bacterium]|nr:radical SAM protein [Candidatus Omnitrophota bacterium]
MKNITGFRKELALLANIKSRELRSLPPRVMWYLHRTFKNEKLTWTGDRYVISTFMPPFPSRAFDGLIKNSVDVYRHNVMPYSAYLALTNKCGFNCWHCSKAHRQGEELSAQKWKDIIKELQDAGICVIGFTGGEPLLRGDLEELVGAVDNRSASILFTTGEGFGSARAKKLKDAGLCYTAISLDHYDAGEHNRLRGSDRAFKIAVDAIGESVKSGFYTAVQLTVRKDAANTGFLDKYMDFVKKLGVQEIRIIEPMPTGKLIDAGAGTFLGEEDRNALIDFHIRANRISNLPKVAAFAYLESGDMYGCGAGIQHVYIDAHGNLCPCDFTPLSFGNLKDESFMSAFSRLRGQFDRPRDKCFILDNIDKLKPSFKKTLPLGREESEKVCRDCAKGNLPLYYKKLGWK